MSWARGVLAGFAIVVLGANALFWHFGYFNGPVFTEYTPAGTPAPFAAVLLSGDLGLKIGMGSDIAQRLAADGIPVVGVNTLAFFRRERSAADATALIATAERRAMKRFRTDRVVLLGQSYGADMLQAGLAKLPRTLRARVGKIILIVPGETFAFRTSPSEVYGPFGTEADARPTAAALTWAPLLCIHGTEETDSLCPYLRQHNARVVALPGGHPMHRDVDGVYGAIARFLAA